MASFPTVPTLPKLPGTLGANPGTPIGSLPINPTPVSNPSATGLPGLVAPANGISPGFSTADGSHTVTGDFKDTYGAGVGTALADTLGHLGSSTSAAVSATNDQALSAAKRQEANLRAGFAAHGVNADSSTAALGLGDFEAQVNENILATDANMELNEENLLIQALQQEGTAHGGDVSGWDSFTNMLQGVGSTVGDIAGAFIGDPHLGDQVTGSIWGGGNHGPDLSKISVPGSEGGTLFDMTDGNELAQLAEL